MPVLLKGFSDDPDFVTIVAEKLRDEERPFIGLYFDNIWASLPASFAGNSEVIDAADEWIERQDLNGPEIYHAAKLTRTERSKRKLLSLLDDSFAFWSAAALLETWGSGDSEVNSRLNSIAIGDNIKAATIAHLLPRILLNPEACRKRLTELLHDSTVRRPDFVLQGLIDLDAIDEQVVQFVVENVLTRKDVWVGDLASTKSRLIRAFPEHPLVKEIALQALSSRVSDMEAPSVGCIAKAYRGDRDIHNRIFEMASPLPKHLRAHVIGQLRSTFLGDQFALDLFAKYDLEENADLKCEASLAYHERVKSSGTNLDSALASLAADICCYGMDHEERRQAAFCGLVTLQRLDLMRAAREGNGGSSPCAISLHSSLAFGPNVPLVNLILEKWDEIRRTLGEDFWKRLSKFSGNPWQYLWDFADQNTQCSAEGIEFIESLPTKNLEIAALRFVGRARPRSQLLMQCCFETLQIDDDRVDMSGDRAITAAEILGSHFHGNGLVLERVLTGREDNHLYNKKLLVLYEAFPAHEALRQAYDAFRRDYRPFNGEMQIRLICQFGTTDEVADMISNLCVRQARPFVPPLFFVNPIARRMSSDSELLDKLLNRLKSSPSPSEKASLSRLLPASVAHASGLRDWAQLELLSQVNEPEIGLDILSGELRPVSHAILDGILPF